MYLQYFPNYCKAAETIERSSYLLAARKSIIAGVLPGKGRDNIQPLSFHIQENPVQNLVQISFAIGIAAAQRVKEHVGNGASLAKVN